MCEHLILCNVTVGEYAGVPLQDPADTRRHGAVFALRKPPVRTDSVSLDGWVTTVMREDKMVVTHGPSTATDYEGTLADALTAANRGLDYLSVQARADCAIRDAYDQNLMWWPDPALGGVVVRCTVVHTFGVVIDMVGTVRYPDGTVPPSPPPPTAMAHDVFRFVRMSRTAENLYDSYRNMFLAFECLLSDIRPPHRGERERQWFTAALAIADQLVPLTNLVPDGTADPIEWTYRQIYSAERSGLMHAKRDYLLPQEDTHRQQLTHSLGTLWRYISDLIAQHLGVGRRNTSLSNSAVKDVANSVLNRFAMVVSDDDSPLIPDSGDNRMAPGANVVQLRSSTPVVSPADPTLWTMLAHCDAADLTELPVIRRFGQRDLQNPDDPPQNVFDLGCPLTIGSDVGRLEMVHGFRHITRTDSPRVFSS